MEQVRHRELLSLSTYELMRRIAEHSDRDAMNHLMQYRRIIHFGDIWVRIPEFIEWLSKSRIPYTKYRQKFADKEEFQLIVNDLTRARFFEFPKKDSKGQGCLNQYRRLLKIVSESGFPEDSVKMEQTISSEMEQTIQYHFSKCINEARRQIDQLHERYEWRRDNTTIMTLYRPKFIEASTVSRWLDEAFPTIDDNDPDFKDKVQEALDKRFGGGSFIPIDKQYEEGGDQIYEPPVEPEEYTNKPNIDMIIQWTTLRKDAEFDDLRPGIRKLGREKLRELIEYNLDGLTDGSYDQNKTADMFGISRPTMSRFAGTSWVPGQETVPDLWRNFMRVMIINPEFLELAAESGLSDVISKLTEPEGNDQEL